MRVGVAAAVKNEAPYLLEWIAFHRAVGIETFFIADNGGNDGTSDLLLRLEKGDYITRFDFVGATAPQHVAYDAMVPRMQGAVDLVAIIDADEFIRPLGGDRVDLALSHYFVDQSVSAVAINWACYGSSNHLNRGEGLVLERFNMRSEQSFSANRHVKSVIRVDRYLSYANAHFFRVSNGRYVDTSGSDVVWDANGGLGVSARCVWDQIRIDHFVVKSFEEFDTIKRPKGRGGDTPRGHPRFVRDGQFFDDHNRNDVYDPMTQNLLTATKNEMRVMQCKLETLLATDQSLKQRTEKIGRNQPCPCGSGRRYKHCHGAY